MISPFALPGWVECRARHAVGFVADDDLLALPGPRCELKEGYRLLPVVEVTGGGVHVELVPDLCALGQQKQQQQ